MRLTEQQLRSLSITEHIFDRLVHWGWCDTAGRSKKWFEHQRDNHMDQFVEEKEYKAKPKKFAKETK